MHDVRIGDRQDHARALATEPLVKLILQIDHVGTRIEASLGVHPVIRRDHEHRAERVELAQIAIEHRIKAIRVFIARRVLMLDIVGGRQVQQVGALRLDQLHTGANTNSDSSAL